MSRGGSSRTQPNRSSAGLPLLHWLMGWDEAPRGVLDPSCSRLSQQTQTVPLFLNTTPAPAHNHASLNPTWDNQAPWPRVSPRSTKFSTCPTTAPGQSCQDSMCDSSTFPPCWEPAFGKGAAREARAAFTDPQTSFPSPGEHYSRSPTQKHPVTLHGVGKATSQPHCDPASGGQSHLPAAGRCQ